MRPAIWKILAFCSTSFASSNRSNLFVSSYGGEVVSLGVTDYDGRFSLEITDSNTGCAPSPGWLTFDSTDRVLYCFDEGILRDNGSVSSYEVSKQGALSLMERKTIPSGPSGGVIYQTALSKVLAISHYNGSALTIWNITDQGGLSPLQELFFYQDSPGPGPRQTGPHEHQILLDPTEQYLVLNAFGLDQIQIFEIDSDSGFVTELPSSPTIPGSGPRHGTFWSPYGISNKTDVSELYYFLIAEITSAFTSYRVKYKSEGGMEFQQVALTNTYGGASVPPENGPAEIQPDNQFVVVSNRNSTPTYHTSMNPTSSVEEYWDNLMVFEPMNNGTLVRGKRVPSGGGFPRNFVFNKAGDRVAVALQSNHRVVVFERDVQTGEFGQILANITIQGEPNCLIWDE
ncbi:uncharacterized protein N7484_000465 [Penicillium longicatenatum]|uniref:uncharacterized protein n=1 Tax=Penicillium longicatenatum TaxID=1561947 RepID=UPI0025489AB4|nr:uncharacterized protein N7484_000465 [Penicillium longicatenatum]KAJ5661093.1 hypothetical protein N7484_000465 [Penicillium longicatenatum]